MSGYVEPPTAPINNSDTIKTLSGIFVSHIEQIVLFALVVTFCSRPHLLYFFFIDDGLRGGESINIELLVFYRKECHDLTGHRVFFFRL